MTEHETMLQDETRRLNREALVELMKEYKLFIRAADFGNWRPTVRTNGDIPGVTAADVTIIATDGLLAFFLRPDGDILYGHIQHFTGEVKPLFSMPKERVIKEKSDKPKRKSLVASALELLQKSIPKT